MEESATTGILSDFWIVAATVSIISFVELTKLWLGNDKLLLELLLLLALAITTGSLGKELLEGLGQAAILNSSEVLNGSSSRGEALDSVNLEAEN